MVQSLLSAALREGLAQGEAAHGQALHACLSRLDPVIMGQLQRATAAVAAPPQQ